MDESSRKLQSVQSKINNIDGLLRDQVPGKYATLHVKEARAALSQAIVQLEYALLALYENR